MTVGQGADRPRTLGAAVAIVFCAISGLLLALYASEVGCGSTDGSFSINDPGARPSGFCDASGFPGLPDTIGGVVLDLVLYAGPAMILLAGTAWSRRASRPGVWRWSVGLALGLLLVAAFLSLTVARVDYEGLV